MENEAPYAEDVTNSIGVGDDGGPLEADLTEVAGDADDVPVFDPFSGPSHGTLTLLPSGRFTYTPVAGYSGTDSFVYRVRDGMAARTGTVTIEIEYEAPVALDVSYVVPKGSTLEPSGERKLTEVAAFDTGGEELTAELVSGPAHAASFTVYPDGTFRYEPLAGYEGTDGFQFRVGDGLTFSAPATVGLIVTGKARPKDDVFYLPEDGTLEVDAAWGLLGNDFVPAGTAVSVVLIGNTPGLSVDADGGFSYDVWQLQDVVETFHYRLVQTIGGAVVNSIVATVTLVRAQAVPKLTLVSETWSDGNVGIGRDVEAETYSKRWVAEGADGRADLKLPNSGNLPLGLVAGGKVTVTAVFSVSSAMWFDQGKLYVSGFEMGDLVRVPAAWRQTIPHEPEGSTQIRFDRDKGLL
ncbi:MAG: Ig-like domain-containing protein, partial [Gemmataceae bacterium]